MNNNHLRTYCRLDAVVFKKTKEAYGGLSNMAGGFPLFINGTKILTAEALYQSCRYPHLPTVQQLIIEQASPMTAKMKSKPYRKDSRTDWDEVRVAIMRWVLKVKLAYHWSLFGNLLRSTSGKCIVEESHKDKFWGAIPKDSITLEGENVLGRLLMELREKFIHEDQCLATIEPPRIPNFVFLEEPIGAIKARTRPVSSESVQFNLPL